MAIASTTTAGLATAAERFRPVFKWPGGKFRLLGEILPRLPAGERFVEPFAGSGAVFLNCEYPAAVLSDSNADLMLFYKTLVRLGGRFISRCRALFADGNQSGVYYERRERFNGLKPGPERAALFLYFNRHGYNGLIRYNADGEFNVPFGRYVKPYFPEAEMRYFAAKVRAGGAVLEAADFRETMAGLGKGDVVYCDPPYLPLSATANFTSYSGMSFGMEEQRALAKLAERAAANGARVIVSNHDVPAARELYKGAKSLVKVVIRRNISCNGGKREMAKELLAIY